MKQEHPCTIEGCGAVVPSDSIPTCPAHGSSEPVRGYSYHDLAAEVTVTITVDGEEQLGNCVRGIANAVFMVEDFFKRFAEDYADEDIDVDDETRMVVTIVRER